MKTTLKILVLLSVINCFGQDETPEDKQYNQSGAAKISFIDTVEEAENLAKDDLNAETPFLFIQGGISPVVYSTDQDFRKVYVVRYHDLGCISGNPEFTIAYNTIILKHLCAHFGKTWKKKIRKDVIGFKQFRKKNGC